MNIAHLPRWSARRYGEKVAFAALDVTTGRVAAGLASVGVSPGDGVALLLEDAVTFPVALVGCPRPGTPARTRPRPFPRAPCTGERAGPDVAAARRRAAHLGRPGRRYLLADPASTRNWVPDTYRPSSEVRYTIALLMSTGSIHGIGIEFRPFIAA